MSKRNNKEVIIDGTCREIKDDIPKLENKAEEKEGLISRIGKKVVPVGKKVLTGIGGAAVLAGAAYVGKKYIVDRIADGLSFGGFPEFDTDEDETEDDSWADESEEETES